MEGPVRIAFTVALLLMWGLAIAGSLAGQWGGTLWLMLGLGHLACLVVFLNFAWLFTYGYALAMVLLHAVILVLVPSPAGVVLGTLGVLYGLRMGLFLFRRYRDPAYGAIRARSDQADAGVPLPARLFLWIAVSWLMTFTALPAYHVARAGSLGAGVIAGALLAAAGLLLEAVADQQKQVAKARNPGGLVTGGLYRRARHPNFAGEILFHGGLLVALLAAADGALALASGAIAPLYMMVLMVAEARKADAGQARRHGDDPGYQAWRRDSGLLLPGL